METAALVRTYDDDVTELLALTARQQTLEEAVHENELETSEEFGRLVIRTRDVQHSIDDTMEELWSQLDTDVFVRVESTLTGEQVQNAGKNNLW